ncbi:MAG: heme-binding protein [Gemmatimonadota bacterium]
MVAITLDEARTIISAALAKGHELGMKPLSVCVLDAGGHLKAFEREDGASNLRFQIAHGKAHGALGFGVGSRALMERAEKQPYFVLAAAGAFAGSLVPVPGGVLVKDTEYTILGAVGITGDTSDNDEIAAIAAIEAAGYVADAG